MQNNVFQNKLVTKERKNKCGLVGDYKCKRWVWCILGAPEHQGSTLQAY